MKNDHEKRDGFALPSLKTTFCRGIGQINLFFAHRLASSNKLCSLLNPPIHSLPVSVFCRDLMVTEIDSFEFIEYFLLVYDLSSSFCPYVLFGRIRCEN